MAMLNATSLSQTPKQPCKTDATVSISIEDLRGVLQFLAIRFTVSRCEDLQVSTNDFPLVNSRVPMVSQPSLVCELAISIDTKDIKMFRCVVSPADDFGRRTELAAVARPVTPTLITSSGNMIVLAVRA